MKITTFVNIIKRIAHRKNIAPVAKSIDVVARGLVKVPGRGARQLFQSPQKSSKCLGFPPYILVLSMTMWLCLWTKLNSSYCGSFQTQLWRNLIEIWYWSSLKHWTPMTWSPLGLHRCSAFHPPKLPNVEVTFLSSILNLNFESEISRCQKSLYVGHVFHGSSVLTVLLVSFVISLLLPL